MKRQIPTLGVLGLLLFLSGCMTHNESEKHPELIGKTFALVRPCYAVEGPLVTSAWWGIAHKVWWIEEKDEVDRRLATTNSVEVRESYAKRRSAPVGTKFTVKRIQYNYESGTFVIGTSLLDGEMVECAVVLAGASNEPNRMPWDLSPPTQPIGK